MVLAERFYGQSTATIIFQVYNELNSKISGFSPTQYSHMPINFGNNYDTVTNSFRPKRAGLYWFLFDSFTDGLGRINYTMEDVMTGESTSIFSMKSKMCVLSRTDLRNLQPQSRLQMYSTYRYLVWEDDMYGMAWGGFNLNDISTNPPIAFSVVSYNNSLKINNRVINMTTSSNTTSYTLIFNFNLVIVSTGQCWNNVTNTFTALVYGLYIFSFSANTKDKTACVSLVIEHVKKTSFKLITMYLASKLTDGTDGIYFVSGSELVMMNANSTAQIFTLLNKDRFDQASFRGFHYAPPNNTFVAWSTRNFENQVNHYSESKLRSFLSEDVINIGNVFRENDTSKAIIPKSGVYYVIFKACLVGNAKIGLYVDNRKQIEIAVEGNQFAVSTYERNILLQLVAENSLSVRIIYGKIHMIKVIRPLFAGFLIAPS